jgi:hypothetical protein
VLFNILQVTWPSCYFLVITLSLAVACTSGNCMRCSGVICSVSSLTCHTSDLMVYSTLHVVSAAAAAAAAAVSVAFL